MATAYLELSAVSYFKMKINTTVFERLNKKTDKKNDEKAFRLSHDILFIEVKLYFVLNVFTRVT